MTSLLIQMFEKFSSKFFIFAMNVLTRGSVRRLASLRPKTSVENEIQSIRKQFESLGDGSVDLTTDDVTGVAILTFNNREKKNGLSGKMMSQMSEVIHALNRWPKGKAVIINGSDHFFSSGGDLTTVRRIADPENGRKMSLLMHDNCTRLQSLPLLSVALIEGMALGGGAEIATSCDFRLLTRSARIGFVHIRIGIVSAWGGGSRLSQLIGPQKALDLMLSGRLIQSEEALSLGLVDHVMEDSCDSLQRTQEWLKKYTKHPLESIRAVKRIVNGSRYLPLELSLEDEVEHSTSVWGSEEHHKGLRNNVKHN